MVCARGACSAPRSRSLPYVARTIDSVNCVTISIATKGKYSLFFPGFPLRPPLQLLRSDPQRADDVPADLPELRTCIGGNHADRCLHLVSRMFGLRCVAAPEAGRLLRILFVRFGSLPADTARPVMLYLRPSVSRKLLLLLSTPGALQACVAVAALSKGR